MDKNNIFASWVYIQINMVHLATSTVTHMEYCQQVLRKI